MGTPQTLLKLPEVAAYLRVNDEVARRYLATGKIRAFKTPGARGSWRVTPEALEEFVNNDYDPRAGS